MMGSGERENATTNKDTFARLTRHGTPPSIALYVSVVNEHML